MFRLSTLLTSLLLAGSASAQVIGGGVGQVIGGGFASAGYVTMLPLVGDTTNASVDLNCITGIGFANGLNAPLGTLLTVSRTTTGSVGSYIDDTSGNWRLVPDNVLRQSNKGCLVEEARTQIIGNTSGVGASWSTTTNTTIIGGQSSPDSGIGAWLQTDNTVSDHHWNYWNPGFTAAASTVYTISAFIKYSTARYMSILIGDGGPTDYFYANVDLVAGVITQSGALNTATFSGAGIQVYTNGWIRVWAAGTISTTAVGVTPIIVSLPSGTAFPHVAYAGTGVGSYVWCPQVEQATFPTSPIPNTSGASVTRAADVVKLTTSPSYTTAVTSFAQGVSFAPATYQYLIMSYVGDGTATNRVDIGKANGTAQGMLLSSQGGLVVNAGTWTSNGTMKIAGAVAAASQNAALNGIIFGADNAAAGFATGMNQTFIGSDAASVLPFNGYLQRVAFWSANRISNAGLQTLTTLP